MVPRKGPTLRAQWLGRQLRELREAARLTLSVSAGGEIEIPSNVPGVGGTRIKIPAGAALGDTIYASSRTLMIGDTSYDMAMARAAGVTAIGVTWGYHPTDALLGAGAHHIASHPDEIIALTRLTA